MPLSVLPRARVLGPPFLAGAITAAGVASLLEASQPAFLVLRVAGAGYLVYVGLAR